MRHQAFALSRPRGVRSHLVPFGDVDVDVRDDDGAGEELRVVADHDELRARVVEADTERAALASAQHAEPTFRASHTMPATSDTSSTVFQTLVCQVGCVDAEVIRIAHRTVTVYKPRLLSYPIMGYSAS